ncbi:MAG: anti-sigma factor [Actinobacteria bacterium]|nr:anti-sigma factor [Actinomycetota bacterium]
MTERFDDLIDDGTELAPEERDRLQQVHDLLLAAGPPPEVPPALLVSPAVEPTRLLPRRRKTAFALVAAALALTLFGIGFLVGDRAAAPTVERVIPMQGVDGTAGSATIELIAQDDSGNWPMVVRLRGLEPSADREDTYELWLTRDGELAATCGVFTVHDGVTTVSLSVPYGLRQFDGWVVTRTGSEEPLLTT